MQKTRMHRDAARRRMWQKQILPLYHFLLLDMFRLLFCLKHTELLTVMSFPLGQNLFGSFYTQVVSAQMYKCLKCN